jgi:3-hydroxyisobutyrate dehydrogenase-like beta-hydroxyacid dehydrogenase
MGLSMCGHVLAKGYPVTVSTRTKSRAQPLLDKGAAWAGTPGEVGAASDIVFTIVGFPSDVREVYFGADGVLSRTRAGQIFVDMTTTEPQIAKEIDRRREERRGRHRRAGLRRRRGRAQRSAADHGRRRPRPSTRSCRCSRRWASGSWRRAAPAPDSTPR